MRAFFEKLENGNKSQFFELLDQIDHKGIDLVQFAKQVIVYADQHLLENMDFISRFLRSWEICLA